MTHSQAIAKFEYTEQSVENSPKICTFDEKLIFEISDCNQTGTDWQDIEVSSDFLDRRICEITNLPGLSEPETIRHYTKLSKANYGIDTGIYPLGSCTMKHNPRLNEKVARMFSNIHPLQPGRSVQGALEVMYKLGEWLKELTNMPCVTLNPAAGAHGELCGIMAIKAAHQANNQEHRNIIIVPESAHGTNPATAAVCGYEIVSIPANRMGRVDLDALKKSVNARVAGIMITNPNTCGIFESEIVEIAQIIHEVGAYFYCDGANFNAIVGKVRPGELGIDCMHINLHKTFSTPHGGGGPGSGPVVFSERLAPYAPIPYVQYQNGEYILIDRDPKSIGRIKGFHGQMGMFTRALSYMMSHGIDGLRQVAEDAALNANYIQSSLKHIFTPAFDGFCKHEALFSNQFLKNTGITTLDIAKAMLEYGIHPMTMYFPLVVTGAMLVEPTESESKESLDNFIHIMKSISKRILNGDIDFFKNAPYSTPRRRVDETKAARNPILVYKP